MERSGGGEVTALRPRRTDPSPDLPVFSHESEHRIADLLDFYDIAWEYEPRTFVLESDPDGSPRVAFTPDFYLPDHDLYLEVTTLRERHPGVRVRILYRRDLDRLLVTHAA